MNEEQLIKKISDKISDAIHGQAREQIVSTLRERPDPETAATIAYKMVRGAAKAGMEKGAELDLDILLVLVTETIDYLLEIIEALGHQVDAQQFRQEAMIAVIRAHADNSQDDPEEQEGARQLLAAMAEDGTLQAGQEAILQMGQSAGMGEQDFAAGAQELYGAGPPQQNALASAVNQGLMGGQ